MPLSKAVFATNLASPAAARALSPLSSIKPLQYERKTVKLQRVRHGKRYCTKLARTFNQVLYRQQPLLELVLGL
eukprot:3622563-Pleurochrysis_carterae.AAC.1